MPFCNNGIAVIHHVHSVTAVAALPRAWVLAWGCPVVFSDNAAGIAALKELTEQREALAARRGELEQRLAAHKERCQVGARAHSCLGTQACAA